MCVETRAKPGSNTGNCLYIMVMCTIGTVFIKRFAGHLISSQKIRKCFLLKMANRMVTNTGQMYQFHVLRIRFFGSGKRSVRAPDINISRTISILFHAGFSYVKRLIALLPPHGGRGR